MSQIVIGKTAEDRNVRIDLDLLIRTRLLIQANSGGGKSWLLRLIAEQLFGKIPIHILDPEGEFASLREKFPFVLIGEGGEAAADIRSAGLVAQRLLELRASAVIDLYEAFRSKPGHRRLWVRKYLEALVDAPKSLWRPLIVIVDEAHKFCPQENPKGGSLQEREIIQGCKDAMIALASVGRKRRFCAVWVTQRLAKVDKDATAELLNRIIGLTFEDVDIERAADLLSIAKDEKAAFKKQIRALEPGNWFAVGRAVSKERVLFKAGTVQTSHPDVDTADYGAAPPPTPDEVKKFLPKLTDLPQEAEQKAQSEADYKKRIRELERDLTTAKRAQPKMQPAAAKPAADPRAIERAVLETKRAGDKALAIVHADANALRKNGARLAQALGELAASAAKQFLGAAPPVPQIKIPGGEIHKGGALSSPNNQAVEGGAASLGGRPVANKHPRPDVHTDFASNGDGELAPYHKSILRGLAELRAIGKASPSYALVAAAAGRSRSGAWDKAVARLRKLGLIASAPGGALSLTEKGIEAAPAAEQAISSDELQARVQSILDPYQLSIFNAALRVWPEAVSLDQLAADANRSRSGAWDKKIASLRKMSILENAGPGEVRAANWLFLE